MQRGNVMSKTMDNLKGAARQIPSPSNYFRGRINHDYEIIDNLIVFTRRSREELQNPTFESRPHHRFVMIFALETSGSIVIDGSVFRLLEGRGILIFPYQFHHFINLVSDKILWLILTFEYPNVDTLSLLRKQVIELNPQNLKLLLNIVKFYNAGSNTTRDWELILKFSMLLSRLKAQVSEEFQPESTNLSSQNGEARFLLSKIEKVIVGGNQTDFPHIEEIAEKIGYSESRLRAIFKNKFGVSLGSYLRNYRIHRAISLMKNPEVTLSQISYDSGFNSITSFCRAFRAELNLTPREYRQRMHKDFSHSHT